MATAGSGLGQLGLWLHLRGRRGDGPALPAIPAGTGPALASHTSADALRAEPQILGRLSRARPGLRLVRLSAQPTGTRPATTRRWCRRCWTGQGRVPSCSWAPTCRRR